MEILYLAHHGILGQKWGVRRYQNKDGSLTELGKKRAAQKNYKDLTDAYEQARYATAQTKYLEKHYSSENREELDRRKAYEKELISRAKKTYADYVREHGGEDLGRFRNLELQSIGSNLNRGRIELGKGEVNRILNGDVAMRAITTSLAGAAGFAATAAATGRGRDAVVGGSATAIAANLATRIGSISKEVTYLKGRKDYDTRYRTSVKTSSR